MTVRKRKQISILFSTFGLYEIHSSVSIPSRHSDRLNQAAPRWLKSLHLYLSDSPLDSTIFIVSMKLHYGIENAEMLSVKE